MKFRDEKIVEYAGQKFEHARIVQGIIIYAIFIAFGMVAAIQNDIKYGLGLLTLIIGLYVAFTISVLISSRTNLKRACVVGLLKLITFPTSTLG